MQMTRTEVANLALAKMAVSHTLVDLSADQSQQARIIRAQFNTALQSMLAVHPWGFTTRFEALTLVQEHPAPFWAFAYAMPSDAAVIRRVATEELFFHSQDYYDQKEQWIEVDTDAGLVIYSNTPIAWAEYTRDLSKNQAYPAYFGRALACQLAMDCAGQLITNNYAKVKELLLSECRNDISLQIANDSARMPDPVPSPSPFERARLQQ